MSEVYVLVKQIPGRQNGEVTLHGVTDSEHIGETWAAAGDNCFSVWMVTSESPNSEGWENEEDIAE